MEKDSEEDNQEFEAFANNNGFVGCFRTSAKEGKNINEALNYLISNIITRMENMESKDKKAFNSKREIIILDDSKRQIIAKEERKIKKEELNDNTIKCSNKEHEDKEAINYCYNCQTYLCDDCSDFHEGLLKNHIICSIDEINKESFTGLCKENNHNIKLEYYCKTHNKLCCGLCICKIKGNGNGEHNDCDICLIKDIKEEIKSIFEKIRTEINNRENILTSETDKYFDDNYFNEGIIKKIDQIKSLLENVESIDDDWEDDDKLNEIIDNCINIENNVKDINTIKAKMEKYIKNGNKFNVQINYNIDNFINKIKKFGYIFDSTILKEQNNIKKFNELIDDDKITNNLNLLYRSSRDEFNYLNIINAINNKSNLIFLYLTENDRIFGAYIKTKLENIDINGSKKYYKDEDAFVFSINNNKKYKILIPEYAISFDNKNYILIGNNDNDNGFYYSDNIINDKQLINGDKIYDFSENSELTAGSGKLIELEIFEIN